MYSPSRWNQINQRNTLKDLYHLGDEDKISRLPDSCLLEILQFLDKKDLYNVFLSNKRFGPLATFQMLNTVKWDGGVLSLVQLSNGFGFDLDICCQKYPWNSDRQVTSYQYKIEWSGDDDGEGEGEWIETRSLNEPSLIGTKKKKNFPIADQLFTNLKAILRNHQVKVIFIDKVPFNGTFFKKLHQLLIGHRVDRLTLNKVESHQITDYDREKFIVFVKHLGVKELDLQSSPSLSGLMNEKFFEALTISNVTELYANTTVTNDSCQMFRITPSNTHSMCRYTNLESSSIVVDANCLINLLLEFMDSVTEEAECNSNSLIVIEGELTDQLIGNQIDGSDYELSGSVQRGVQLKNSWTSKRASVHIRQRGQHNMVAIRFS